MAVVLPHGALFRMGKEGKIRQKILEHGPARSRHRPRAESLLRHRPGRLHPRLPPAQGEGPQEQGAHPRRLEGVQDGPAQNELLPEHVERIYGWYRDYKDVEGVARVVTLDEIAANDHNLNIPRYVEPKIEQEVLTVEEAMKRLARERNGGICGGGRLIAILKREGLLDMSTRISQQQLESYLWGAANAAALSISYPLAT